MRWICKGVGVVLKCRKLKFFRSFFTKMKELICIEDKALVQQSARIASCSHKSMQSV